MFGSRSKPIVFAGPSVDWLEPRERELLDLRPPVRRGDLDALLEGDRGTGTVLILDGLFGSSMAVSPTECRNLLSAGWNLMGASSMGALRAADLWPAGMIGIGSVYDHYRLGYLRSDADVAVAYDSERFRELTASTVHVRSVLQHMVETGALPRAASRKCLQACRSVIWHGRYWPDIAELVARIAGRPEAASDVKLLSRISDLHPKKRDACLALNTLFSERWTANRFHLNPASTRAPS